MSNVDTNVSTTGDGFIVGVEPAATPASRFAQGTQDTGPVTQPPPQQGQTNGERTFTEAQVEEFRKQEKDKVYPRIESMAKELEELKNERDAARKAAEDAQAAAEAEAKAKAQEEMTVRDLLRQTQEQFEQQITSVRTEAEIAKAELEQERRLQQLRDYRSAALSANAALILPDIADYVAGETPEQIDASIADAIERSERIAQGAMAVRQQAIQGMQGVRSTSPTGNGPLEEQQEQKTITPEQIRAMSPSEYAAHRGTLHAAGRAQFYGQR